MPPACPCAHVPCMPLCRLCVPPHAPLPAVDTVHGHCMPLRRVGTRCMPPACRLHAAQAVHTAGCLFGLDPQQLKLLGEDRIPFLGLSLGFGSGCRAPASAGTPTLVPETTRSTGILSFNRPLHKAKRHARPAPMGPATRPRSPVLRKIRATILGVADAHGQTRKRFES